MTQSSPKKFPPKKRISKRDQESLDDLNERGVLGRNNPGSPNAEYSEMRSRPGIYPDQEAHPGFEEERYNHRQKEFSHVDVGPLDSVFTAFTNETYRLGGWPKWAWKATSHLDRHIYERMMYRQGTFDGYCNESTRKIARAIGATGDAVQRSIRYLKELKLLVEIYPASGKSPAYFRTRSPWELDPPTQPLSPRRQSNFHTINQEQKDPTARPSLTNPINEKEPTEIAKDPSARPSRPDRADGQKTKTTVEVGEGVASAPSLPTSRKIERPKTFPEIHDENKSKFLAEQESRRPKIMGHFSPEQMSEEIIDRAITESPTLSGLLAQCEESWKRQAFNETTKEWDAGGASRTSLVEMMAEMLTCDGDPYDLRYPQKAIEIELSGWVKHYREVREAAESDYAKWIDQQLWH